MMIRVIAFLVAGLAATVAVVAGLLGLFAWSDFRAQGCAERPDWDGNNNCSDARVVMDVAGPAVVVGLIGFGLGARGAMRA